MMPANHLEQLTAFLEQTPDEVLLPFLWEWLHEREPRIAVMIDDMLRRRVAPEDLLAFGPAEEIPLPLRQALTRMAAWRKRTA